MALRHGRWLWYYQRRLTHWTFGDSDGFSMSTGQNSSPMMRYALVRGSHFCPTLSRHLFFFGHLHRTDPSQNHYRALQACILGPVDDWRRRIGSPRQSWLRMVEADLRPMNLGLTTSKRRAQDRSAWRKLVTTATSTISSWRRRTCCPFLKESDLKVVLAFCCWPLKLT